MVGPDGQAGIEALAELVRQHGPLPATPLLRSGGGGLHYYFAWPGSGGVKTSANYNGLPIDIRGTGGYVVAPPSLHKSGNRYTWEVSPDEVPLADAPAWLLGLLQNGMGTHPHKAKGVTATVPPAINNGLANENKLTLTVQPSSDVRQRVLAYLEQCPAAVSGSGGHDQTFAVARAVVYGFDLGPEVGFELLKAHYNPRCQPPWTEAELWHKCQDANQKPFEKPRGHLLVNGPDVDHQTAGTNVVKAVTPTAWDVDIECLPMPQSAPWPELTPDALYGLPGDIVRTLAPETESDPVAILGQLLVAFGNAVGRGPYYLVEGDKHHTNLFANIVGESSRGRKGTSRGRVMQLMSLADHEWCERCVTSGLSSGEGLIWSVRDPIFKREPIKEKGRVASYQEVEVDLGVSDKRLLVNEGEFAQCLRVMQREGNSLSPTVRQAWDMGTLRTLTKNNPARATNAHVSISGHITKPELAKYLSNTEFFNGFANRFFWLLSRRARLLPDGGRDLDLSPLATRLSHALTAAHNVAKMVRTPAAGMLWHDAYAHLTAERPGLYGAVTGRAEAQVLRLSMIYTLMDGQAKIDVPHLRAALAIWQYADASAKLIFGTGPEDPLPGLLLAKLYQAPNGLTRTDMHNILGRNLPAAQLVAALAKLKDRGDATPEKIQTAGRPAELWKATHPPMLRKNEESPRPDASPPANEMDLTSFVRASSRVNGTGEEVVEV